MTKKATKTKYLEVAVFWGNSEFGRYEKKLSSCNGVRAGKGFFSNIRCAVWPRWDDLEIIQKSRGALILNPNLPWDGVVSNGSDIQILSATKPLKRLIEIKDNSTASLRIDDMTVVIRVGERRVTKKTHLQKRFGYILSPFSFVAEAKSEWSGLLAATLGAAIIMGSIWWALDSKKIRSHSNLTDLPEDRLLPFIGQTYLASAPHVMQTGLDRFDYIRSVWRYYSDLVEILGFGIDPGKDSKIFSSTIEYYQNLAAEQAATIKSAEDAQQKKLTATAIRGPFISVPTVRGESLDGKALRIFDKIALVRNSANELAQRRIEVAKEFAADIGYKFEQKKSSSGATEAAFAKISEGFMGVASDDKMQEQQAADNAAQAASKQIAIYGKERLRFGPNDCCSPPAGSPLTADGMTWARPDFKSGEHSSINNVGSSNWGQTHEGQRSNNQEPSSRETSPDDVEKTVAAGRHQIRLCYELALRRNEGAQGSMEWRWVIDSEGRISDLNLLRSTIKDAELVKCVREKIATWRFPQPRSGSIEVRYPFEFSKNRG